VTDVSITDPALAAVAVRTGLFAVVLVTWALRGRDCGLPVPVTDHRLIPFRFRQRFLGPREMWVHGTHLAVELGVRG